MNVPTVSLLRAPASYRLPVEATFGPRLLESFEFVWILAGSAEVQLDDHRHVLAPGQLQLSRPGMVDHYMWRGKRPAHAFAHFTLDDRGRLPEPQSWPLVRRIPANGAITGLLADLVRLHSPHQQEEANQVTALLLDRFVLGTVGDDPGLFATDPYVAALIKIFRRTWSHGRSPHVTVTELADGLALSRSQTTRMAIKTFGVPPREMVELLRLSKAATLLRRSNAPVKVVATTCGFGDQFHFAKRFRSVYGTTPTAYRAGDGLPPDEPLAQCSSALTDLADLIGR